MKIHAVKLADDIACGSVAQEGRNVLSGLLRVGILADDHLSAVGRKGHAASVREMLYFLAGGRIPQTRHAVALKSHSASKYPAAVGRKAHARDHASVSFQAKDFSAGVAV